MSDEKKAEPLLNAASEFPAVVRRLKRLFSGASLMPDPSFPAIVLEEAEVQAELTRLDADARFQALPKEARDVVHLCADPIGFCLRLGAAKAAEAAKTSKKRP